MVKTLKSVTLDYEPFKKDEVLRVCLHVERSVPYISSEWPSRLILWLSRRYHVTTAYYCIHGDNAFTLNVLILCNKDFFRYWSHNSFLEYVRRIVK